MEVVILPTPLEVTRHAARTMAGLIGAKPDAVLGLATGASVRGVYAELVRLHREEALSFHHVTTFNLDEYVGIRRDHPGSYHAFMEEHFFRHVDVDRARAHLPAADAADIPAACAQYERDIQAAGGIDLQLLGIGSDGHIGFNEPTSSLASRTRIKTLTSITRADNRAAFGDGPVPLHVITMGIGTILEARRCVLVAFGSSKANAVARMVEGPLTAMVPASALQLHPHATILVDEEAAERLTLQDYYRTVQRNKPSWQRDR
ncbi:MAG: glucosamine-6-phosphate deaminase [Myxococcota bacterium]